MAENHQPLEDERCRKEAAPAASCSLLETLLFQNTYSYSEAGHKADAEDRRTRPVGYLEAWG
jgi:hypothetical protein